MEREREREREKGIAEEGLRESSIISDDKVYNLPFPVRPKIGAV